MVTHTGTLPALARTTLGTRHRHHPLAATEPPHTHSQAVTSHTALHAAAAAAKASSATPTVAVVAVAVAVAAVAVAVAAVAVAVVAVVAAAVPAPAADSAQTVPVAHGSSAHNLPSPSTTANPRVTAAVLASWSHHHLLILDLGRDLGQTTHQKATARSVQSPV